MRVRLLMLANDELGGAAVELDSGALVRVSWSSPRAASSVFDPYEVVEADRLPNPDSPFGADAVVAHQPEAVGRMRGRRAARLVATNTQPPARPLFGVPTATVPYWTLAGHQPSLAIVTPDAGPVVERDPALRLRCRFRWRRLDHDLPLSDPRLEETLSHPTASRLAGPTLARAVGWKIDRLLLALTPPRDGQCHKVVAGLLPRP